MIDKDIELQWESNSTSPLIQPDNKQQQMKFIELKVIQITPLIDEQRDYADELESAQRLGIKRPELPDTLKPVSGTRSFNVQHFTILSWSSIWDNDFDQEIIIVDILWSTGMVETINLLYSAKEWREVLSNWA